MEIAHDKHTELNESTNCGETDLIIIGGGPAGLSAAIRAKEEGISEVLVIERNTQLGGILNQCIHHGFGLHIFKEELTGPEYAGRLIDRGYELGVRFLTDTMVIDLSDDRVVTFISGSDKFGQSGIHRVRAKAVILAMGCRERTRGAIGIPGGRGRGVYTAGTMQALVNMKGIMPFSDEDCSKKRVVILGSGDIGLIMARRMTLEGAQVLGVYELQPFSAGLKRNIAQCLEDYGIPLYLSHTVTRVVGNKKLEGVYVAQVGENREPIYETEHFVACEALLLSVGLLPENELSKKAGVLLSSITGGALVDNKLSTNIPGIFSCGNVLHVHDLADDVTLESYRAGKAAADWIKRGGQDLAKIEESAAFNIKAGQGVRYVSPSYIRFEKDMPSYELLFRSDGVYKNARINLYAGEALVKSSRKRIVTPGEMERMSFSWNGEPSDITVEIVNA